MIKNGWLEVVRVNNRCQLYFQKAVTNVTGIEPYVFGLLKIYDWLVALQ